jgi:hypothetical protein
MVPEDRVSSLSESPKEDFLLPQRQMKCAILLQVLKLMLYYIITEGEVLTPTL